MENSNILQTSLDNRIKILFKKLESSPTVTNDLILNGLLLKMPIKSKIPNKSFYRFKVRYPISYESTTRYRIRTNLGIFDLYKKCNNYYFVDTCSKSQIDSESYIEFTTKPQFTFIYYLVFNLLTQLNKDNYKIRVIDSVFKNLTEQFNSSDKYDLTVVITPNRVSTNNFDNNILYISIFN